MIRRFVRFAAAHPELNQIMVHEATARSERLRWMTERHVRPLYDAVRALWRRLRKAGIAAPIDDAVFHYVLVGAASLPYVNAPEARLLTGAEPTDPPGSSATPTVWSRRCCRISGDRLPVAQLRELARAEAPVAQRLVGVLAHGSQAGARSRRRCG